VRPAAAPPRPRGSTIADGTPAAAANLERDGGQEPEAVLPAGS